MIFFAKLHPPLLSYLLLWLIEPNQYLFDIWQEMEKSSYFPSPLRKDYTSKPVRNFNPIIIKKIQKPVVRAQPALQQEKVPKYSDGILVSMIKNQNQQSGIFFKKDSSCILFNLEDNKPHGENYVIYLSGVILSVNYAHGFIHKWLVGVLDDKFIVAYHYRRGVRQGLQYFYDMEEKLMVISEYQRGKLIQIREGIKGQFNKIFKNQQVFDKIMELKSRNFLLNPAFPKLNLGGIKYFGQINDRQDNPHGYGVLFGEKQIFIGQFNNGFLNGLGGIKFQNDDFYYGQFNNGVCLGYGSMNIGNNMTYKFDSEDISRQEFGKFLQVELLPTKNENWLQKYRDLEIFHEQYKRSFKKFQEQRQLDQDIQNIYRSEINLEIEDSISKRQQLIFQETNGKSKTPIRNSQMIPKLSLFQQMKMKQKANLSVEDRSARINQDLKLLSTDRNHIHTERNQRDQRLNQNKLKSDTKTRKVKIQNKNQREKLQRSFNPRQERPDVQEVGLDKWYVSPEHNFMKPNQLQPKAKIDRTLRPTLQKNNAASQRNMGKLMKVGSDVSDNQEANFLNNMLQ